LDAMGASALMKYEGELEAIRKAIRENNSILALEPAIASAHESIEAAKRQVATAQESIAAKRSALKEALEASEQAKREIRAREGVAIKESKDRAAAVEQEVSERILSISDRLKQTDTELNSEIAKLQQELSLLPPPADTSPLEQAQQALEAAERSLSDAEQAATASNTRIGMLNERISTLKKSLTNAGRLKAIAAKLADEIAHWTALSKAFGNDGIVALTIDDAGPTLASLANDLLLSCYGPRFSVAIRTQEENAKGDMKETFDIMVFDSERGDEKSVRDMSGGEKIYINEALTRAMALYQAQASGQRYECLFADESDGALDAEKKRHYVTAMRRVMQLGGYKQCFWISHTPELWDMADATINMEGFRSA
jgi:DNA repair protein SbcC/Rad50